MIVDADLSSNLDVVYLCFAYDESMFVVSVFLSRKWDCNKLLV